ncbi:23S rRNA (uracil(1939)-C(5))-methyltransferase RlmD [Oceanivirga miroungae]|uniref:TrmA family RNA methyltransferase n=1 Tax=Oceanivirga miroungae TaxID=1130046 RepID=A0A6I8M7Q7_9FUSO|nr:23S rRNA (uracil(1939)-C(5))-methyltransferase RlmD [Oceanivirga miroungae]VWL85436.1 TrmA family RNA methyltransferase [Oceanivirga miroungae]
MIKVNDILEVKIEKVVYGGEGMAYIDDFVIFVPLSCVGDLLKVKVISTKKTYARAIILEILKASDDRVEGDKISFKDFNGCDFAMLKYEKQLEYKKNMLKELFSKMSNENIENIEIIGASKTTNYRNKVAEPFFIDEFAKINTGFFERKSHNVFSNEKDILKSSIGIKITKKVLDKLNEKKFTVYDEKTNAGFLKHLIIRNNSNDDVMLAIVVYKKSMIDKLSSVLKSLYEENKEIKSVYISVKNSINNVILGDENIHIIGDKILHENLSGINFKIYLDSFFQVNLEQVNKLYDIALGYIDDKKEMAIDAFSGTGTISMLMSNKFSKVYAIEYTKSAVVAAKKTAKENNIENIKFIASKVEDKIENIVKYENISHIVFDPPRKGIDKTVLDSVAKNNIKNIVYISCEPSTYTRDLNILKEYGYKLKKIKAVDMFPQTHHIEIVSLISKDI